MVHIYKEKTKNCQETLLHRVGFTQTLDLSQNLNQFYRLNGFSSVQFSHSVVSDSLQPHELQHARPPCPSPTPGVYSNSCPSSWWCHPAISSSVIPFSSCSQSLPASGSFPGSQLCMRWPKYWSFSFSISPSNEHPGLISFRMDWLDLLAVQGTLKSLLQQLMNGERMNMYTIRGKLWEVNSWCLENLKTRKIPWPL